MKQNINRLSFFDTTLTAVILSFLATQLSGNLFLVAPIIYMRHWFLDNKITEELGAKTA